MDISRTTYSRLANIDPGLLLTFLLVAEERNLTRAAERRHTTPSAASAQLRMLEDRLGVSLFLRSRRGMEPTAEGNALIDPAQRALDAMMTVVRTADRLRGDVQGSIRLGLNAPPELLRLTPLLSRLRDRAAGLEMALFTSHSGRIIRQIRARELDAGFVLSLRRPEGVEAIPIDTVEVRAYAPAAWPLDRLPETAEERASLLWIEPDGDCPLRTLFAEMMGDSVSRCRVVCRSDGEASTLALVKAGLGIGLIDRSYAEAAFQEGTVRMLDPPMTVGLHLIMPGNGLDDPRLALLSESVVEIWTDRISALSLATAHPTPPLDEAEGRHSPHS